MYIKKRRCLMLKIKKKKKTNTNSTKGKSPRISVTYRKFNIALHKIGSIAR